MMTCLHYPGRTDRSNGFLPDHFQFVAYRADYWFIDYYHRKTGVGIYAQATKFLQLLWILPTILAGLIVPALKNQENKMTVLQLTSVSRLLFFSHILLGIMLAADSYLLYECFLPGDFSQGFHSLLLMMPGYLLFIFSTVLAAYFSANRFLKINLTGSVLCFAIILILDFLLISRYSYTGAAIASSVSYAIKVIFFIIMMNRKTSVSFKDFFK
jgi:O-antigen/teichoic acid export membrane protein